MLRSFNEEIRRKNLCHERLNLPKTRHATGTTLPFASSKVSVTVSPRGIILGYKDNILLNRPWLFEVWAAFWLRTLYLTLGSTKAWFLLSTFEFSKLQTVFILLRWRRPLLVLIHTEKSLRENTTFMLKVNTKFYLNNYSNSGFIIVSINNLEETHWPLLLVEVPAQS